MENKLLHVTSVIENFDHSLTLMTKYFSDEDVNEDVMESILHDNDLHRRREIDFFVIFFAACLMITAPV